ncbi:MAG: penicillin acylase family protein, partial [Opitutales bacterium]
MRISRSTVRLVLKWSALGLAGLLTVALLTIWLHIRRSLPQLEGEVHLPGLEAAVTVERDAQGVPTIHAESRLDAARALGFLPAP